MYLYNLQKQAELTYHNRTQNNDVFRGANDWEGDKEGS